MAKAEIFSLNLNWFWQIYLEEEVEIGLEIKL